MREKVRLRDQFGRKGRRELEEEIKRIVDEVYKNAEVGMRFVNSGVEGCRMWELSIGLGDVAESLGYVLAIERLYKELGIEIPREVEKKMREIKDMHWRAYRLRDEFHYRCTCTTRKQK